VSVQIGAPAISPEQQIATWTAERDDWKTLYEAQLRQASERDAALQAELSTMREQKEKAERELADIGATVASKMEIIRQLIGGWRATSTDAEWSEFDRECEQAAMELHHIGLRLKGDPAIAKYDATHPALGK
jgi:predicted  nucleic acid-binding Zn-ribbon protein